MPNLSGSDDQCFLITDANFSDIASPSFCGIWCSCSTWFSIPKSNTTSDTILAGFWQHRTFAGVLLLPSLLVMGLFWLVTGPLLLFSVLFLNNVDKSSKWVFLYFCLFLLLVIYLSKHFIIRVLIS